MAVARFLSTGRVADFLFEKTEPECIILGDSEEIQSSVWKKTDYLKNQIVQGQFDYTNLKQTGENVNDGIVNFYKTMLMVDLGQIQDIVHSEDVKADAAYFCTATSFPSNYTYDSTYTKISRMRDSFIKSKDSLRWLLFPVHMVQPFLHYFLAAFDVRNNICYIMDSFRYYYADHFYNPYLRGYLTKYLKYLDNSKTTNDADNVQKKILHDVYQQAKGSNDCAIFTITRIERLLREFDRRQKENKWDDFKIDEFMKFNDVSPLTMEKLNYRKRVVDAVEQGRITEPLIDNYEDGQKKI